MDLLAFAEEGRTSFARPVLFEARTTVMTVSSSIPQQTHTKEKLLQETRLCQMIGMI